MYLQFILWTCYLIHKILTVDLDYAILIKPRPFKHMHMTSVLLKYWYSCLFFADFTLETIDMFSDIKLDF